MFKDIKLFVLIFGSFLLACGTANTRPLSINFSADSSKIIFTNINQASLFELKKNIPSDTMYQKLVSVLQTPADDDSTAMEVNWPGKLSMQGDTLVYIPATAFQKGKSYLVETMIEAHFANAGEVVSSKVGTHVKPSQKILKR